MFQPTMVNPQLASLGKIQLHSEAFEGESVSPVAELTRNFGTNQIQKRKIRVTVADVVRRAGLRDWYCEIDEICDVAPANTRWQVPFLEAFHVA